MKTANGWDVYLIIKQLSGEDSTAKPRISIDDLVKELGIKKDMLRQYITALAVLDFIEFTDSSKEIFVMTDLGKS